MNTKYTLIATQEDGTQIIRKFTDDSLSSMLEHYQYFLKGVGFEFQGIVNITDEN